MLCLNSKALCRECLIKLEIIQPDNTEATEKFVCKCYEEGVPTSITAKAEDCKYYKSRR